MKSAGATSAGMKATVMKSEFRPSRVLANRHIQSALASGPLRKAQVRKRAADYLSRSREQLLHVADHVCLQGFFTRAAGARRDAQVVLLHGWEGSADSSYLLSTATELDQAGFDTFRLNFRDHGRSHHLNEGLFHSCLLEEVLEAVQQLADGYHGPSFVVGFSLGGNFALRIARQAPLRGLELQRVVAVSPAINPHHVLEAMESSFPLYQQYFSWKWRRSLKRKQAAFPHRYDFSDWFRLRGVRQQTEWLIRHHTRLPGLEAYLQGYSVAGEYLQGLETPTLLVTAADDPIVPVRDASALPASDALDVEILARGGHCGFLANWRLEGWMEQRVKSELIKWIPS